MDRTETRAIAETRKQRQLREAFKFSVVLAGLTAGVFFVWLAFAAEMDGFLATLSCVFGAAIAAACVIFAYMKA